MRAAATLIALMCFFAGFASAQSTDATITGRVLDPTNAVIAGATVQVIEVQTNIRRTAETNQEGIYVVPNLKPGIYRVEISKPGFKTVIKPDIVLHVQDVIAINFSLPLGSVTESITVTAGAPLINTESGTVGTVVDRQFVGNIPLNGRSLQSLITLTPGVVRSSTSAGYQGQFSINGQRTNTNYFTLDGVSANIGSTITTDGPPEEFAGSVPALTSFGGTNGLVSIDALEAFKIQTSSFAPEFGRTPGGQISLVTRSGTNDVHGALFEYFRNDALDANDWFANRAGLKKPALRMNQFGGVLGGPIVKNRTFFFFSYEGLRLRQPRTRETVVPSLRLRQAPTPAAVQTLLNAFPVPTGPEFVDGSGQPTGQAPFVGGFSDPHTLNATSFRIDHAFSPRLTVFGRYNEAPSDFVRRGRTGAVALSNLSREEANTRTITVGATFSPNSELSNDFRFNYSRAESSQTRALDTFGKAVPFDVGVMLPSSLRPEQRARVFVDLLGFSSSLELGKGTFSKNIQRQINVVDNLSYSFGQHHLRFGIDYRRLFPVSGIPDYHLFLTFDDESAIVSGTLSFGANFGIQPTRLLYNNFSAYAQDTWKVTARLTLTYGLRWDVNPPPSETTGKEPFVVSGVTDLATATLAPTGTPLYETDWQGFAPRLGVAYLLAKRPGWETVLRGGFGMFYDLGNTLAADAFTGASPFKGPFKGFGGVPFPLTQADLELLPFDQVPRELQASDSDLRLPYTFQWNVAVEQSIGSNQTVSASYVAAVGRRLLKRELLFTFLAPSPPAPLIPDLLLLGVVTNEATSDYHGLQLQYQHRLSRGLQALVSYTWSHAIDEVTTEFNVPNPQVLRGNSDLDVRHNFSAAVTYDIPSLARDGFGKALLGNWSIDTIIHAQSAYPFTVIGGIFFLPNGTLLAQRPNLVPDVPIWVDDPAAPGGRRVNPAAFQVPPFGEQGNLGRNTLRGFPSSQVDFALRRAFPVGEHIKLVFRTEAFNIFNNPNFANPESDLSSGLFGQSTQMLGQGLGGLSPIFQTGGPRSMQFALRLEF